MDPQQRATLIEAVETAFAEQGIADIYPQAQRLSALLDSIRPHIAATHSRDALDAYFASASPVDAESFQQFVAFFLAAGPIFTQFAMDAAKQTVESQPRKAGPPVRITPQHKRAVVDYVSRLYHSGGSIGIAHKRTAQHFGCSLRSVQRIWQRRGELAQHPFLSMNDIWKFFAK